MPETRIAIRDDSGVLRQVTKIVKMADGFAVSVPYHSAREGWIVEHPMHYDKLDQHTVRPEEMIHFTAGDRVKLSFHLSGFVQFSSAGGNPIRSGFDKETQTIKGVGLRTDNPVCIDSGPAFGVQIRGLEEFKPLGERKAVIFEREDLWHHPRDCSPTARSYNLEGFILPVEELRAARGVDGKRILLKELPFMSLFAFRHEIRVIELPGLSVFVGLILSRMSTGSSLGSGYVLAGPGCGPPGTLKKGISAFYPRPAHLTGTESLDYVPPAAQ